MENRIIALCEFEYLRMSSPIPPTGPECSRGYCPTCIRARRWIPDLLTTKVLYLPVGTPRHLAPDHLGDIIAGHIIEILKVFREHETRVHRSRSRFDDIIDIGPSRGTWLPNESRATHSFEIHYVDVPWNRGSNILSLSRDDLAATLEMIKLRGYKDELNVRFSLRHRDIQATSEVAASESKEEDVATEKKEEVATEKEKPATETKEEVTEVKDNRIGTPVSLRWGDEEKRWIPN